LGERGRVRGTRVQSKGYRLKGRTKFF